MCIAAFNFDKNQSRSNSSMFIYKLAVRLYIFNCHKLHQWGWVTSSRNISYDPSPTYTDQSKYINMAINHIINYTK